MRRALGGWAGTLAIAVLSAACGHEPVAAPAAPAAGTGLGPALAASPGTALTVSGRFAGWSGPCRGGVPRTRSDWMLVDDAGRCLYVSGPLPPGVAPPPDRASVGQPLTLTVVREATPDGQPYLRRQP